MQHRQFLIQAALTGLALGLPIIELWQIYNPRTGETFFVDRDPAQDEVNSLISAIREGKAIEIAYLPCQADLFGRKTDKPAKKATPGNGKPAGKAPTKAPTMPSARA